MKRSPSKEAMNPIGSKDEEQKLNTFGVQLRKTADRKPRSVSESGDADTDFRSVTLRKPRSQSTGDMLDDEDNTGQTMDEDLFKLMLKRKAAAERGSFNLFAVLVSCFHVNIYFNCFCYADISGCRSGFATVDINKQQKCIEGSLHFLGNKIESYFIVYW